MLIKMCKSLAFLSFIAYSNMLLAGGLTNIDISKAQGEMTTRIYEKARQYLKKIGISDTYLYYCTQELHLHTYEHPANGYIPFGVNYNTIKDRKNLEYIISSREDYETSYILLCLANSKNTLTKAEEK